MIFNSYKQAGQLYSNNGPIFCKNYLVSASFSLVNSVFRTRQWAAGCCGVSLSVSISSNAVQSIGKAGSEATVTMVI